MIINNEIKYVPEIGAQFKLATWEDYTSRDLPMWSWLVIRGHALSTGHVFATLADTSSGHARYGELLHIALEAIEKPIGWREVYEIRCEPSRVDEVLGWLTRGIVVRQSQYIGDPSTAYQPIDNSQTPHWKFGAVTDVIPADEVSKRVRVISHEYVYDAFVSDTCQYCKGRGVRPHGPSDAYQGTEQPCAYCNAGIGAKYFSGMNKQERKDALKALSGLGWKVEYSRSGRHWYMVREIVVKDVIQ